MSTSISPNRQNVACLRRLFSNAKVATKHFDEPLCKHSSWQIGGPADLLVEPATVAELAECCRLVLHNQVPYVFIGHGTNLLFDDAGLRGVVIKIAGRMANWHVRDKYLRAQAGLWVPKLARIAAGLGLSGLEHIVGIPGTVGGLTVMNGGSLRRSIGDNIVKVRGIDLTNNAIVEFEHASCNFQYRCSRFQRGDVIIGEVSFSCEKGESGSIRREMLRILRDRRRRFPRKRPNCGSVFVSDSRMFERFGPPGKVIEDAGLKGVWIGAAQVSPLHANFIVNCGGATSNEVLGLIAHVGKVVHAKTGIWMQTEVRYVHPGGYITLASDALGWSAQTSDQVGDQCARRLPE